MISQHNCYRMSVIPIVSIFVFLGCFTRELYAFGVSIAQYEFLFEGQLKKSWILERQKNLYFLTCTQKCLRNSACIGIALGPINENENCNKRTCYLLKYVDAPDQYCSKEDCDAEHVEVYEVSLSFHTLTLKVRGERVLNFLSF